MKHGFIKDDLPEITMSLENCNCTGFYKRVN